MRQNALCATQIKLHKCRYVCMCVCMCESARVSLHCYKLRVCMPPFTCIHMYMSTAMPHFQLNSSQLCGPKCLLSTWVPLCEIIKELRRFVFVLLHLQRKTFNWAIFIYLRFFFSISFALCFLICSFWHGNSNWFLITTFMLYNSCWHCCHNQCAANISAIDMAKNMRYCFVSLCRAISRLLSAYAYIYMYMHTHIYIHLLIYVFVHEVISYTNKRLH